MATQTKKKDRFPFTRRNWIVILLGLGVILIGYIFLSRPPAQGFFSLTLAPILLVVGYCVIVPIAILLRGNKRMRRQTGD